MMMQAYPLPWKSGDKCAEYTTSGREASYARTVHSQLGYDERSCSYGLCAAGLKTTMYFDDDEIWDHRAQWLNHHCYFLYVRTRRALATDDGAMAALSIRRTVDRRQLIGARDAELRFRLQDA